MPADDWIDCHFHVFRTPGSTPHGVRYAPPYGSSVADWAAAAPAGPRRGVVVQPSFLGTDNAELLEALRSDPDALRGVAVVDPSTDPDSLRTLHDAGVRGIRLNLVGASESDLDALRLPDRLARGLLAFGWNVELHTDPGTLPQVLERIDPRLTVVLDHFGKPATADRDDPTFRAVARRLAAGSAPVWVKLSGPYRLGGLDPCRLAGLWRETVGAERLVWGSDWPCTNHEAQADYPRLLAALDDWIADPVERRRILVGNPMRLYWGDRAT